MAALLGEGSLLEQFNKVSDTWYLATDLENEHLSIQIIR